MFFIDKEIQSGGVAKSYMRKGFQIHEEIVKRKSCRDGTNSPISQFMKRISVLVEHRRSSVVVTVLVCE
jgi:hypothetical protein